MIDSLESAIASLVDESILLNGGKAKSGQDLPESAFLLASRLVPIVNVDLLIQDDQGRTLLTWRDDKRFGTGWHIPGGVIRLGETTATRIIAVAQSELDTPVTFDDEPIRVAEIIEPDQLERSHHVALLYRCKLDGNLPIEMQYRSGDPQAGQWAWHSTLPEDILNVQRTYAQYFQSIPSDSVPLFPNQYRNKQLLRYLIVGAWNTLFGYGSFALLTYWLTPLIPASYMVASLLSSLLNITVSFLGYKWWVFKTKGNYLREWLKALMVYSGSIAITLGLLPPTVFAVSWLSHDQSAAPYIAGALLMVISVLFSFLGHKRFTFRS